MISRKMASVVLLGCLLSACALHEPEVDWKNGAKRGWIVELYSEGVPAGEFSQCTSVLSNAEYSRKRFAKVKYRHVRLMHTTLAQIPDSLDLRVNDQVEWWPEDCERGKISRISRSLPSTAK